MAKAQYIKSQARDDRMRSRRAVEEDQRQLNFVAPGEGSRVVLGKIHAHEGAFGGFDQYTVGVHAGLHCEYTGQILEGVIAGDNSSTPMAAGAWVSVRLVGGEPPLILPGSGGGSSAGITVTFDDYPHHHTSATDGGVVGGLYGGGL